MSIYKVAAKVLRDSKKVMEKNITPSEREDLLLNIALAAPVLANEVLKSNCVDISEELNGRPVETVIKSSTTGAVVESK